VLERGKGEETIGWPESQTPHSQHGGKKRKATTGCGLVGDDDRTRFQEKEMKLGDAWIDFFRGFFSV